MTARQVLLQAVYWYLKVDYIEGRSDRTRKLDIETGNGSGERSDRTSDQ